MITVAAEKVISISQYKYSDLDKSVKMFISGLTSSFTPITVVKGDADTMTELAAKLSELFAVEVILKELKDGKS